MSLSQVLDIIITRALETIKVPKMDENNVECFYLAEEQLGGHAWGYPAEIISIVPIPEVIYLPCMRYNFQTQLRCKKRSIFAKLFFKLSYVSPLYESLVENMPVFDPNIPGNLVYLLEDNTDSNIWWFCKDHLVI